MKRNLILLSILICTISASYCQTGVSGYIKTNSESDQQVVLSKKVMADMSAENEVLAVVPLGPDGYFSFDDSLFTPREEIYNLEIGSLNPSSAEDPGMSLNISRSFILSNRDSLFFYEGAEGLVNYTTNSKADREWQKLKAREQSIEAVEKNEVDQYTRETREYMRDSLQILLVKLLSIQNLDDRDLLDRDIKDNPDYYLDLLQKLRQSDLDPSSYANYEIRIQAVNQDIIQRKYYVSSAFNVVGLLLIMLLGLWLIRNKKRAPQAPLAPLSKQENNIKDLIIEGKTNKEIAEELFISISTVKTHITNIYSKLNVSNRKELILRN